MDLSEDDIEQRYDLGPQYTGPTEIGKQNTTKE